MGSIGAVWVLGVRAKVEREGRAVTTYRRRLAVPDGHYAVADPAGRLTFWAVVGGRWVDWPDGARWRPECPRPVDILTLEEHRLRRQDWYEDAYGSWCEQVADAIEADPVAATERFRRRHGTVELPPARQVSVRDRVAPEVRVYPTRAERERHRQVEMVAVMRLAGLSYSRIARVLGVSKTTAYRRASQGPAAVGVSHGFTNRGTAAVALRAFRLVTGAGSD
jgi:hypothetical protein